MPLTRGRHYVVVVHGMGEQRQNATAPAVVQRFAEARAGLDHVRAGGGPLPDYLLPANLSSQSIRLRGQGHGWSEFEGVPLAPGAPARFTGRGPVVSGANLRFVDLRWAHILQTLHTEFASPVEQWSANMLARLNDLDPTRAHLPSWVLPLLEQMQDSLLTIKRLLDWKYPDVSRLVFDAILDDVHVYGDYQRTRGQAVRHFHAVLDEIHLRDFIDWCRLHEPAAYVPPTYTVVAHSLGSIMTFDALAYARAHQDVRTDRLRPRHPSGSLPFPGYDVPAERELTTWAYLLAQVDETDKDHPGTRAAMREHLPGAAGAPDVPHLLWRNHVTGFVTLGSPIDKFHVLWPQNYAHMRHNRAQGHDWIDDPETPIPHFNLCDEQDPVGHHLDTARATPSYPRLFDAGGVTERDIVFRRYPLPGVAHTGYWQDRELFEGILDVVVDQQPQRAGRFLDPAFRERPGIYEEALQWAYFRIPFLAATVTGVLVAYGALGLAYGGLSAPRVLALVAAVALWRIPLPRRRYGQADDTAAGPRPWLEWRRGVLATLVWAAALWRRILILEGRGAVFNTAAAVQGQVRVGFDTRFKFHPHARKRYAGGAVALAVSLFVWLAASPSDGSGVAETIERGAAMGLVLSLVYLLVMAYARRAFHAGTRYDPAYGATSPGDPPDGAPDDR